MKNLKSSLGLFAFLATTSALVLTNSTPLKAGGWDNYEEPVNTDPSNQKAADNEYPPGDPVPPGDSNPTDPSSDLNLPVPDLRLFGGPAVYVANQGVEGGAGIGVAVVLEGGVSRSTLVMLKASAVGRPGQFGYGTIDARFRYRIPVDKQGILWAGFGGDINYRGTKDNKIVDDYFKVNLPVGLLGTLQTVKVGKSTKCVVKAFIKGSVAIFDNEILIDSNRKWKANWSNFVKPTIGIENDLRCDTFEIQAEYEHSFTFAGVAKEKTSTIGTDVVSLDISKVWPVHKDIRVGFFINSRLAVEHGDASLPASSPVHDTRYMNENFTGLQVNF